MTLPAEVTGTAAALAIATFAVLAPDYGPAAAVLLAAMLIVRIWLYRLELRRLRADLRSAERVAALHRGVLTVEGGETATGGEVRWLP